MRKLIIDFAIVFACSAAVNIAIAIFEPRQSIREAMLFTAGGFVGVIVMARQEASK